MLDITILKTAHGGDDCRHAELRARKLIPYIEHCDVFSIESALVTEQTARDIERVWAGVLKSKITRQKFHEGAQYFVKQERNPTIRAYTTKAYEYVFRNKRALYCSERCPDDAKADLILGLWTSGTKMLVDGLNRVTSGDERGYELCYQGSRHIHRFVKG